MQSPFIFLLVLLVASCAPNPQSTGDTVASTSAASAPAVTADTVEAAEPDAVSVSTQSIVPDTSLYIGEVGTFSETGEFFTPLYYHEHLNTEGLYEHLSKQSDSLIYEDVERRRSRIPMATAKNYFNLFGLDTISVYKESQLLCQANLVRVEHYQDVIESQFVAVFKPVGVSTIPEEPDYCVSAGKSPYKNVDITCEEIEDEQLTKKLLQRFAPEGERVWRCSPWASMKLI